MNKDLKHRREQSTQPTGHVQRPWGGGGSEEGKGSTSSVTGLPGHPRTPTGTRTDSTIAQPVPRRGEDVVSVLDWEPGLKLSRPDPQSRTAGHLVNGWFCGSSQQDSVQARLPAAYSQQVEAMPDASWSSSLGQHVGASQDPVPSQDTHREGLTLSFKSTPSALSHSAVNYFNRGGQAPRVCSSTGSQAHRPPGSPATPCSS